MGFQKCNDFGKKSKRGKGKKTIVFESLDKLNKIGITPLQTSKDIIESLVNNSELSNKEQLSLLGIMTSLYRYELLTRSEEIKLDELQKENEELLSKNEQLNKTIISDSTQDLLKQLQEK